GLEEDEAVLLIRRHLPERLEGAIGVGPAVVGADQPFLVRQPGFLERPADAEVADEPAREGRHPAERADADHDCLAGCELRGSGRSIATRLPSVSMNET